LASGFGHGSSGSECGEEVTAMQRLESVATGSFLEFQFALRIEFAIYFIPMTMPK
jgi:hypothetical protein